MAQFSPTSAIKLQLIKVMLMRCHFILPSLEVVLSPHRRELNGDLRNGGNVFPGVSTL
jgi:hypothetical protein